MREKPAIGSVWDNHHPTSKEHPTSPVTVMVEGIDYPFARVIRVDGAEVYHLLLSDFLPAPDGRAIYCIPVVSPVACPACNRAGGPEGDPLCPKCGGPGWLHGTPTLVEQAKNYGVLLPAATRYAGRWQHGKAGERKEARETLFRLVTHLKPKPPAPNGTPPANS